MMEPSCPAPLLYLTELPDENVMIGWLRALRRRAFVPGSHYQVAAIMMMRVEGGFYFAGGVNAESAEHRLSLHGEESAIATLVTAFGKKAVIDAVWLMAAPDYLSGPAADSMADIQGQTCGNCRQQISGLAAGGGVPVRAISLNGDGVTDRMDVLLPKSFSFGDFDPAIAARREQDRATRVTIAPGDALSRLVRTVPQTQADIFSWLSDLDSIDYASGRAQAVVLSLANGHYVAGVRVENAAYTGLNAVQAAFGVAVTACGGGDVRVTGVHILSGLYPPSLAALQILRDMAVDDDIPVSLYDSAGACAVTPLTRMMQYQSGFAASPLSLRDGELVRTT